MRQQTLTVGALGAWMMLWLAAWQPLLANWPWVCALIGFVAVVVPGLGAVRCLRGRATIGREITEGFAAGVSVLGLVGLVGCLAHWPFAWFTAVWGALGAMSTCAAALTPPARSGVRRDGESGSHERTAMRAWIWLVPLAAAMAVAARFALVPSAGGDNFAYNAMMTEFARGAHLGFADPVFDSTRLTMGRYWIAFWPLMLALMSAWSGIDGVPLSALYVTPPLAALAVLAVYELARGLGLSRPLAVCAAVAQVAVLLVMTHKDQAGWAFFTRLREDKVAAAFIMAPIWFRSLADYFRHPDAARFGVAVLLGLGLLYTHPIMLVVASLIAILLSAGYALASRRLRPALAVVALATALSAVPAGIRAIGAIGDQSNAHRMYFSVEAAQRNGAMYLAREQRLDVSDEGRRFHVRTTLIGAGPLALLACAAAAALLRIRRERAAHYVVAATAVVVAVLIGPTARLLGFAITPFHLWRVPWLAPFGIAAAFLLSRLIEHAPPMRQRAAGPLLASVGLVLVLAVSILAVHGQTAAPLPARWREVAYWAKNANSPCAPAFADLRAIGDVLDARINGEAFVIGDESVNDFLPTVSSKARMLVFRTGYYMEEMRVPDIPRRLTWYHAVLSPERPSGDRLQALRESGAAFLVTCSDPDSVAGLAREAPDVVREIARAGRLVVYAVTRQGT